MLTIAIPMYNHPYIFSPKMCSQKFISFCFFNPTQYSVTLLSVTVIFVILQHLEEPFPSPFPRNSPEMWNLELALTVISRSFWLPIICNYHVTSHTSHRINNNLQTSLKQLVLNKKKLKNNTKQKIKSTKFLYDNKPPHSAIYKTTY